MKRNRIATIAAAAAAGAIAIAIAAAAPAHASNNTNRCNPSLFFAGSTQACVGATVSGTEINKIKGWVDVGVSGTFYAAVLYPGGAQSTGTFTVANGDVRSHSTPTATVNKSWPAGDAVHVYLYKGTPGHATLIRSWNGHVRDLYASSR